jgi:hypothetical protein
MAAVLPAVLADLTNAERQSEKLDALTVNPILNKAAEMKAEDMATKGYFAHTSPEGKTPWYWLDQVGYQYEYAGENLAINFTDSKDVTDAWMNSPTHRANIVKDKYTEVGTGISQGIYNGKETVFVVQVYANPITKEYTILRPAKKEAKISTPIASQETANVLGAETKNVSGDVQNNKADNVSTVIPVVTKPIQKPTFFQKIFSSPRDTTDIIFYIIFGIIALALILYVVIKMENHNVDLITNALIVLAIIGLMLIVNYYFSHKDMITIPGLDYVNQNK